MTIRLWGNEALVNTTTLNGQSAPVVTALQNGGYVIAWVDDMGAAASAVKFQRYDAFGKKVGAETTVASPDGEGDQINVSICTLSNGTFVIAHEDRDPALGVNNSQIAMTRYAADGTLLGQNVNSFVALSQPVIHESGSGFRLSLTSFVNAADTDPITFLYNAGGTEISAFNIDGSASLQRPTDFALGNPGIGEVATLYVDEPVGTFSTLYLKYNFTVGGSSAGPFLIDTSPNAFPITNAHIAFLKNGGGTTSNYVVSYTASQGNQLIIKLVTFDGVTFHTPAGAVTFIAIGNAGDSFIKVLDDGTFVVAWHNVGALRDVHLQQFDSDGHKIGVEMIVNSNGNEIANLPSIDQLADGRLIVTWEDGGAGSDGNVSAINQQILDPRDGIVNGTNNAAIAETLVGNDAYADQMRGYAGADTMYGLAGADVVYGGDGADQLFGGRGDDTLYGGLGVDTLIGGLGADDMDGGAGTDVANYRASRVGVTVNLLNGFGFGGDAEGDTLVSMESIFGSDFDDVLTASNSAATFYGFAGADILTGDFGADSLVGGVGGDTLNGSGGIDTAFYTGSSVAVTINLTNNALNAGGEAAGDQLSNIENIQGSAQGDTIVGNSLANKFFGNGGNDSLNGGTGVDTLVGGTGSDSFVFALGGTGQTVATADIVEDYSKGLVGTGDKIDFTNFLTVGGVGAAATTNQADISQTTGIATFFAGSGTTMADALADIATSMTTGGNVAGEFAFFKVNNTGNFHLFISDGVAGVGANDVLVQLTGITTIASINLTAGDLTILT